jgi:hypothetical protein
MKKLASLAVSTLFALTVTVPVVAQPSNPHSNFQPTAQERGERNERHPAIRAAIRSLEKAKDEMQHAAHDFGGHRVDAIKACDEAIRQLQLALQYDKK